MSADVISTITTCPFFVLLFCCRHGIQHPLQLARVVEVGNVRISTNMSTANKDVGYGFLAGFGQQRHLNPGPILLKHLVQPDEFNLQIRVPALNFL